MFPDVVYENNQPAEYAAVRLTSYADDKVVLYDSMSELIEHYYAEKDCCSPEYVSVP